MTEEINLVSGETISMRGGATSVSNEATLMRDKTITLLCECPSTVMKVVYRYFCEVAY